MGSVVVLGPCFKKYLPGRWPLLYVSHSHFVVGCCCFTLFLLKLKLGLLVEFLAAHMWHLLAIRAFNAASVSWI
jgi:hypothetical protein